MDAPKAMHNKVTAAQCLKWKAAVNINGLLLYRMAFSATIIFAADPTRVKLPATVETHANNNPAYRLCHASPSFRSWSLAM